MSIQSMSMRSMRGRPGQGRRGANAIEFALTLPFFIMVVIGLMDYGYLFSQQAQLDNAVALSCRKGAMSDPLRVDQRDAARYTWNRQSAIVCASPGCTFNADFASGDDYLYPNRALECLGRKTLAPLSGFVPFPSEIRSSSLYRLEWQQETP